MRYLLGIFWLTGLAIAQPGKITPVLSQSEIEALEKKLAGSPGKETLPDQALLGKNYALYILGVTALKTYDMVDGYDAAKAVGEFANHAKAALLVTNLAAVAAEGGGGLWKWTAQVSGYRTLHGEPKAAMPILGSPSMRLSEAALDRAIELEPSNQKWRMDRSYILKLRADEPGADQRALFQKIKVDLSAVTNASRSYFLTTAGMMAVRAGEWADAKAIASELLTRYATAETKDWNDGNVVYAGNTVLGLVALHEGDKQAARERLLAAGATKGSPQLGSFGPNMTLVKELIAAGERDTVLKFFEQCGSFWKMERGRLAQWSAQVAKGEMPNFGGNLNY